MHPGVQMVSIDSIVVLRCSKQVWWMFLRPSLSFVKPVSTPNLPVLILWGCLWSHGIDLVNCACWITGCTDPRWLLKARSVLEVVQIDLGEPQIGWVRLPEPTPVWWHPAALGLPFRPRANGARQLDTTLPNPVSMCYSHLQSLFWSLRDDNRPHRNLLLRKEPVSKSPWDLFVTCRFFFTLCDTITICWSWGNA